MLVIRRTEGQWVEVTHRSGDTLRFRVYDLNHERSGRVHLAFDDPARNFAIQRPERALRQALAATLAASRSTTNEPALDSAPAPAEAVTELDPIAV